MLDKITIANSVETDCDLEQVLSALNKITYGNHNISCSDNKTKNIQLSCTAIITDEVQSEIDKKFEFLEGHELNILRSEAETMRRSGIPMRKVIVDIMSKAGQLYHLKRNNCISDSFTKSVKEMLDCVGANVTPDVKTDINSYTESVNPNTLRSLLLNGSELLAIKLQPRENIVAPFITVASLAMVFASRGLGKTWFSLQMALSVAQGVPFMSWSVPRARKVLFFDGEMTAESLATRLRLLGRGNIPDNLHLLLSELLVKMPLNLNNPDDQKRINKLLQDMEADNQRPELLIFDNLSSLCSGADENSNNDQEKFLHWLISLRHKGYAVLLVQHAGKNGDQRGASRREDFLDTSIKLTAATTSDSSIKGAKFTIEFVKCRGERPNPDKLTVGLTSGEHGGLEWIFEQQQKTQKYLEILKYIHENKPGSQKEIAISFKVTAPRISELLTQAREKGFIELGKLVLTKKGQEAVSKQYPEG